MTLQSPRFRNNRQLQRASNNAPPLNTGTSGEGVRLVQQALIDLGFPLPISVKKHGSPDGIYGTETKEAIRSFQKQQKISPDGIAGRNTMEKLDALFPNPGDPLPPLPGQSFTHRVKLHFRSIATPVVSEFEALRNAQMVYRQFGIDFAFSSGISLNIPSDQAVVLDNVDVGTCQDGSLTSEQTLLFGLGTITGVGVNDITVFYVNRATKKDGTELVGCANSTGTRQSVLVAAEGSRWTLGHEVGHVLLGAFKPTHSTDPNNLMFIPTANIVGVPPTLTPEQLVVMKASRFCQPIS